MTTDAVRSQPCTAPTCVHGVTMRADCQRCRDHCARYAPYAAARRATAQRRAGVK